ncbi:MAG: HAMP domain-containing histidine kinase [Lachnospiraceae bacterium]|nr:HAMP domain-containing histidine kinase [Lachnospiraceae bacterium]
MNHKREEQFIITLVSVGGIGLVAESVTLGWEFWVPPLLMIGLIALWWMYIEGKPKEKMREICYFTFSCFLTFFHGVHETSFWDIAIVYILGMVVFSFFNHLYMVNFFLAEYAVVMMIQTVLVSHGNSMEFSVLTVSRILLQPAVVLCVYFCCLRMVKERAENETVIRSNEERIESYDEDMEDFLSNISHELRTPVNVVNGMSDLLIKRNAGDEAYSIKEAGIRLSYQIEDIQDYTEAKRNKLFLAEEEYMSTSLVNDVVVAFRAMDVRGNQELIVDIDPMVPAKMKGDIKKLHKIFRHLLENAVKFTKAGGIYVKIYAEQKEYGVNLCIEVTDTGIGMTRMDIASVSEGMYQVNKKRNRSSGGIGLGFAIVYGFAHRMGGFVKIESEKGKGTTVRVTIPQKVTDKTPCLKVDDAFQGDILFHVRSDKFKVAKLRDFYRAMARNLASGIKVTLYSAETVGEIERLREKLQVSHIFMGVDEYEANRTYFDKLSKEDIVITVSAEEGFRPTKGIIPLTPFSRM